MLYTTTENTIYKPESTGCWDAIARISHHRQAQSSIYRKNLAPLLSCMVVTLQLFSVCVLKGMNAVEIVSALIDGEETGQAAPFTLQVGLATGSAINRASLSKRAINAESGQHDACQYVVPSA